MGFYNTASYMDAQMAQTGVTNFNDTTLRNGKWWMIKFIEDTVFTTLTESADGTADTVTGKTYLAGTTIEGKFTTIELASGFARAYKTP